MPDEAKQIVEQPQQQMFCCAVVEERALDGMPTDGQLHWLHTTCHDYWKKVELLAAGLQWVYGAIQANENGEYLDDSDCLIRIHDVLHAAGFKP